MFMKIKDLRALSSDALKASLSDLRLELAIERRNIKSTGVASKKVKAGEIRRTIARVLTLLNERGVKSA
jgi:large subunit ribosomal protein L29